MTVYDSADQPFYPTAIPPSPGVAPATPARAPLGGGPAGVSRASSDGVEVLVGKLADMQYKGRRVQFGQVTGIVQGVVQTMGLAVRLDGSTTARAAGQKLHLVDDGGRDHYLEFTAADRARILD